VTAAAPPETVEATPVRRRRGPTAPDALRRPRRRGQARFGQRSLLVRALVVVIAFVWSLPTAGLLISSLRPPGAIATTGWWTVFVHPFESSQWTLQNYATVLSDRGMFDALVNSVAITIPATVIPISLAAFAAYAFAWIRFPGRRLLFALVVGLLVVPLQMTLVPLLQLYVDWDLTGTYLGTWLAHTGFGLPMAIFLLYNYIADLPKEILESAYVDGASHFTAFTRLVLPLAAPVLAAFAIFQFLWVWNDFLVAYIFLGTNAEVAVLTAQLQQLVGTRGEDWHLLTAGAFVSMVVPLVVFLAMQRYFVRGLLTGGVKG
jgi:alpha-glucoside transport system permease protein